MHQQQLEDMKKNNKYLKQFTGQQDEENLINIDKSIADAVDTFQERIRLNSVEE